MFRFVRPLLAVTAFAFPFSSHAADTFWSGSSNSTWENNANWVGNSIPTSDDTAVFGNIPTSNKFVELSASNYSLEGVEFQQSGFFLQSVGPTTITITGGSLSSTSTDSDSNLILPTLAMTATDNTITVSGNVDHELQTGDLNVTGSLTTNIDSSLCLAGSTTITGAFTKTGSGQTCTEGGFTAASTSVQNGLFLIEGSSSLGAVAVSSTGSIKITAGTTATAESVTVAGVVNVGEVPDNGETLIASGGMLVQTGGELTGYGKVHGDVTVEAGGKVMAGGIYGSGTLNIEGDINFQTDSVAVFTIVGGNLLDSTLIVDGNLTLDGILSLNDSSQEGLFTLIDFTGILTGGFTGIQDADEDYNYQFIYNPHSVQVSVTAVPEPATWGLLVLGLMVVGYGMRKKHRSAVN